MSPVGIVGIVLGLLVVVVRGSLLVAPEPTLRWFKGLVATNGRLRLLGGFTLTLGAAMVWAGSPEDSILAGFLTIFGWGVVGMSALLLLLFPGVYRAIATPFFPSDAPESLFLWRFGGLMGVIVGALLIYFGALAL
jgi:hypothetical protein